MTANRFVRLLMAALGVTLFAYLLWRVGPQRLAEGIAQLGWGLAALILLGGVSHLIKTWAWRFTLDRQQRPGYFWMVGVRLAGEAVSQISFAGQVFGETTRALLMKKAVPLVYGVSSVVLDRGLFIFTGLLVIVFGTSLAPLLIGLPQETQRYQLLIAAIYVALIVLAVTAIRRRWPVISALMRVLARLPRLKPWAEGKREGARQVEAIIHSYYHDSPGRFWSSFGLNLAGHGMSILEVFLTLRLLGLEVTLLQAFLIEALTKVVNFAGAVIPGNVGAYEGGNMLILRLLELGAAHGLTLGITRRIRGLFWAAVGLLVLFLYGFNLKRLRNA
ncbi:MAG: lysylphosphatidylglycerol synthase domain-containing protein, partial [Acidobacteriota bacterium]